MKSIVVAYPSKKTATRIKNVLQEAGFYVSHMCPTGSAVLKIAAELNGGIIICPEIFGDMSAGAIAERVSAGFDIIALSQNGRQEYMGNLISLPLPLDIDEFIETVGVLVVSKSSFTNRSKNDNDYINNAKAILIESANMSESKAHKYLQQLSMQSGKKIVDVAIEIIDSYNT